MDGEYSIPAQTRIGHVHLKVANLERSLEFYQGLLGFNLTTMYGSRLHLFQQAVTIIILA